MTKPFLLIVAGFALIAGAVFAQLQQTKQPAAGSGKKARSSNPIEVGTVKWRRDFDKALADSRSTQKPVFVLFQEVPGCSGCQAFGKKVLSNPLLVEAIESEFIPVLVFNNRSGGKDSELLRKYREPAWNYQVVRFLNSSGTDIIPRKDKVWTTEALASRMAAALKSSNRKVPKYLMTLADNDPRKISKAAFAMSCFWTGEYQLGNIDGVVETEAGWLDGREVTLVHYNTSRISLEQLAKRAEEVRCAQKVYTMEGKSSGRLQAGKLDSSYRTASKGDQKRQLQRAPQLTQLPNLTQTQLTKLNALAPRDMSAALQWLSPRQRQLIQ